MIHTIRKYLDMPFVVTFALILICVTAWSVVIHFHILSTWVLLPLELISLYTIVLTVYWIFVFIRSRQFRDELEVFETIQKKALGLALSMELNLCFSVYYIYVSFTSRSGWFACVAFFYVALTIARFILLREFCFEIQSLVSQYKRYIAAGYLMLIMMVCLFIMTMMEINSNYVVEYPGISFHVNLIFSTYMIISAVRGYHKYKKYRSPLLSGNQMISISAALLGILSLQTAILPKISHYPDDIHKVTVLVGIVIFVIMITMSLYMIIHGGRTLAFGLDKDGNRLDQPAEEDLSDLS